MALVRREESVAEQPVPQDDPVVSKSYALHYAVAMLLLTASLLWALWDEAYGQRPWKSFQHAWKQRYSTFLNSAKSSSANSQKAIESDPEITAIVPKEKLAESFSLERQLRNVDKIFARVFQE